ncbi:hypothetical protein Y032_0009g730 [Ancylostoma ceylanicum]|uniref:Uncharacterized protein n=1 Tax=Ancylostoma ceylanicum TaxID=53326 RepID=A0A016VK90_9BILA|nr:hypothetical protein Y032_0009g730 [Ancylostoma ceylanicum]
MAAKERGKGWLVALPCKLYGSVEPCFMSYSTDFHSAPLNSCSYLWYCGLALYLVTFKMLINDPVDCQG